MSTSGGNPDGYRPLSAGQVYAVGLSTPTLLQLAHQLVIAAPLYLPSPARITGLGVNVSTAGGAGATVQPAVYQLAANGDPGALLLAGPVLNAAAAGAVSGPVAGTIPAGWTWLALLCLAATAPAPIVTGTSDQGLFVTGGPALVPGYGQGAPYPQQAGQAVLPANFAPSARTVAAPAVWLGT